MPDNMKSVFFKYPELLQWFAQTKIGKDYLGIPQDVKDIVLLLPNGYIQGFGRQKQAVFYSRAEYSLKLYKALGMVDVAAGWLRDFSQAQSLLLEQLKLIRLQPVSLALPHFLTSTFVPDSSNIDGIVQNFTATDYTTLHNAANGTSTSIQPTTQQPARLRATTTSNQFDVINRGFFLFNTSALGQSAVISSAKITLFVNTKSDTFTETIEIVSSSPAANNTLAISDYPNVGTTIFASNTIASLTTSANNDWTLNASGRANISLNGTSKFGARLDSDRINTAPTWSSAGESTADLNFSGSASNKPTLTVTYTVPLGGIKGFSFFM